jgi:hypothetical protein
MASTVILGYKSRWTHDHNLLSQIRDSPNLEGQVPVFISPTNKVAQLYPQALGSSFIASYDSQGYGGGIRPHLHKCCMALTAVATVYIARVRRKFHNIITCISDYRRGLDW